MSQSSDNSGLRHARTRNSSALLMIHGAEVWSSELADISATGVQVLRP